MKRTTRLSALCIAGSFAVAVAASAQDASQATQQQTQVSQQTTQISTVNGKVVRYEPGKTIVVLGPDNKEVTYTLSSTANVPADVEVGRVVSLSTEPSPNGPALVTRVTVRSMTCARRQSGRVTPRSRRCLRSESRRGSWPAA